MKAGQQLLVVAALSTTLLSCGVSTHRVMVTKRLAPLSVIGTDPKQLYYGYWSGTPYFRDGVAPPYDTTWTLVMRDPQRIAYDDRFLLLRNAKGKSVIVTTTQDGKAVYKATKSEVRYQELRTELAVPESLVLQEIR